MTIHLHVEKYNSFSFFYKNIFFYWYLTRKHVKRCIYLWLVVDFCRNKMKTFHSRLQKLNGFSIFSNELEQLVVHFTMKISVNFINIFIKREGGQLFVKFSSDIKIILSFTNCLLFLFSFMERCWLLERLQHGRCRKLIKFIIKREALT